MHPSICERQPAVCERDTASSLVPPETSEIIAECGNSYSFGGVTVIRGCARTITGNKIVRVTRSKLRFVVASRVTSLS